MSFLTLNTMNPKSLGQTLPGDNNGLSTDSNATSTQGQQPLDQQSLEQMAQLLMELLKPLLSAMGGDSTSDGSGSGNSPVSGLGGSQGSGANSSNPFSALANTSGLGGGQGTSASGSSPFSGLGNTGQSSGVSSSPQDYNQSTLNDMSSNGLDQSISGDDQTGGSISDNPILKALLKIIAQMMDGQNGIFGQPDSSSDSSSGDGSSGVGSSTGGGSTGGGGSSTDGGTSLGGGALGGSTSGGGASQGTGFSPTTSQGNSTSSTGTTAGSAVGSTPISDQPDPLGSAGTGATQDVGFPTASANPTVLHDTITVKAGEVFDGKGQTFTAGSELGNGDQSENQKPLFKLEDGASLKNVVIGDNGADGIHLYGDAKIDNLHVTNVGEDAITVKANPEGKKSNVDISNSTFANASDKILQLNADTNLTVNNVKAKDFGTFVRTNGGQQGDWNLNLNNISAENGKFSFVKSDSEGLNVNTSNVSLTNVENHFKVPASAKLTGTAS